MLDEKRGELALTGWRGSHPDSARFWEWVDARSGSSCGEALARRERVIVPDLEAGATMADTRDLDTYRTSGIRAVQSTPLVLHAGQTLGMISTHWHTNHTPTSRDLRLLDVLARQAADVIERAQASAALKESEQRLRRLADNIPLLCRMAQPDGYNQRWFEYTGSSPQQIEG